MTKKQRTRTVLQELAMIIILGFIYMGVFLVSGRGIPCWFNKLTGLKCPGCGMTHAIAQLWTGHIKHALEYNALCVSVLPIACLYILYRAVCYVNNDEAFCIWEYVILAILLAVTIGYGIMRNIL
ncbi:MAG: DUF2752 domain-containing protein [Lachnospiraceae bacterium]|nr:DUF2752 domain-containing protein [Lachnospiraceae bacterium]